MEWIPLLIFICFAVINLTEGQRPAFGACPKIRSAKNVKVDKVSMKEVKGKKSMG